MRWDWLSFPQLSSKQLYDVLQLREQVFHIEQQSIYKDIDDIDLQARHLLGLKDGKLFAYLRMHLNDNIMHIGRVVLHPKYRRQGLGTMMLQRTIEYIQNNYSEFDISLSAQDSQIEFYKRLGFEAISAPFDDAGILHVRMTLFKK